MTLEGIRTMLAAIISQEMPKLALMGAHSYSVEAVQADGRCDLKAKKKGPPATFSDVDHWCGLPGGAGRPTVGSTVVLTFLDGDRNAPMVVGYQPLRLDGGKPDEVTVDGVTVKIGPHADLVEIAGGNVSAADDPTGTGRVVRYGDPIVFGPPGPGTVTAGAIVNHFSKAKA